MKVDLVVVLVWKHREAIPFVVLLDKIENRMTNTENINQTSLQGAV